MIGWMQKHNKYLIVTIWIATIAFIGAGFVGWGSYSYGSKASSVAQVGNVEISKAKLDLTYVNLYEQYNVMFKGKFDDEQAKKMNLLGQAFNSVATQAKLLNLANEFGIVVSDKELATEIAKIQGFQKEGAFSNEIYQQYLKRIRLKANVFEEIVRDDVRINKLFSLLNAQSVEFEQNMLSSSINIADKIRYRVITPNDKEININVDENKLKAFWEKDKEKYRTPKRYVFDVLWTQSSDANYTDAELDEFYRGNSFHYIDANGTQLSLADAKDQVLKDLKLKKTKKQAQKAYIQYKKDQIQKSETLTLDTNSPKFTKALWDEIHKKKIGDILKPRVVDDRYATLKIIQVKEPETMKFEEARSNVVKNYQNMLISSQMKQIAKNTLNNIKENNVTIISDYLMLDSLNELENLSAAESNQFLGELFKSTETKGTITVGNKIIVYNIIDQKLSSRENNETQVILDTMNKMKDSDFQSSLLKELDNRYKIKTFVKGL
jgi:peptidyl-prolyl cis-trans isomerase D